MMGQRPRWGRCPMYWGLGVSPQRVQGRALV